MVSPLLPAVNMTKYAMFGESLIHDTILMLVNASTSAYTQHISVISRNNPIIQTVDSPHRYTIFASSSIP